MSKSIALRNVQVGYTEVIEVDARTVQVRLFDSPPPRRLGGAQAQLAPRTLIAEVTVEFASAESAEECRRICVEVAEGSISSPDLRGLQWSRILQAAGARHHARGTQTLEDHQLATDAAADLTPPPARRRGRPRKDAWFYQDIARRYLRLQEEGHPAPVKALAHNLGKPEGTVRSWLHRARKDGYLPPHQ